MRRKIIKMTALLACAAAYAHTSVHAETRTDATPATDKLSIKEDIDALTLKKKQLDSKEAELAESLKDQARRLMEQRDAMDQQGLLIKEQSKILEEQKRRLEGLQLQIEDLAVPPVEPPRDSDSQKPPAALGERPPSADQASPGQPAREIVGQPPPPPPPRPQDVSDILESRSILTRKGTMVLTPSVQYINSSVTHVALDGYTVMPAITIGSIDVREVDRNSLIMAVDTRYGFTNRLEGSIKVPYVLRHDRTTTRPLATPAEEDKTSSADGAGLGDIELACNYQFNNGGGGSPFYVGSLRFKSRTGKDPFDSEVNPETGLHGSLPTGSGFLSLQPGLSISIPSDPAVFYTSVSYLWNMERNIGGSTGRIDPGDALGIGAGFAFAFNDKSSFSLGFSHSVIGRTTQNGKTLPKSDFLQVGTLTLGITHRVSRQNSLSVSLSAGLTEDAPDIQITFRLPMAFTPFS